MRHRTFYELRKWYCDVLTPQNQFVFVYFVELIVCGRPYRSLTIHCYREGETTTRTFALPGGDVLDAGSGGVSATGQNVRFMLFRDGGEVQAGSPGCSIHLCYRSSIPLFTEPLLIGHGRAGRIIWQPLLLGATVSGVIDAGGKRLEISNAKGYADFVASTILPRRVPVRTLRWGRLHHDAADVTFVRTAWNEEAPGWSAFVARMGSRILRGEQVFVDPGAEGDAYGVRAPLPSGELRLNVRHGEVIQDGGFIDQQGWKCRIADPAIRLLTRDPRSTKWASSAHLLLRAEGKTLEVQDAPMVDELASL
jgi:hypothetical protein